jgi:hypothetical protein
MWLDVAQNEEEWMRLRIGRVGGSELHTLMANYGKAFGDPAHRLAQRVALEQISGEKVESGYTNEHMERGHEQEPIAKQKYEEERFCSVANGGYYILGDDIGVSPDGIVYDDGLVEIKSVAYPGQFDTIDRGKYDPKYKWQLVQELKVSGREWVDYISFCADFPPGKQLFIQRIYKKEFTEEFKMVDARFNEFRALIDAKKRKILSL